MRGPINIRLSHYVSTILTSLSEKCPCTKLSTTP